MTHGKQIQLKTTTGTTIGIVELVSWTRPVLRKTHNPGTFFKYQTGKDQIGKTYETKARGGGWRLKRFSIGGAE